MAKCLTTFQIIIILSFCGYIKSQNCPDGTQPSQACTTPTQCANGFTCINGFCCQTCQFRRQISVGAPFVPTCDLQGNYAPEQCDSSRGQMQCWCSLSNGQEIPNTRIISGSNPTTRDCNVERQRFTGEQQNQCGLNEEFNTCPSLCQPSCTNPQPNQQGCQPLQCIGACVCRTGFLRRLATDPRSTCVLSNQCNNPSTQCTDVNSQFNPCGSSCPPSCTNQNPVCSRECVAGCFCNQGFVKQSDLPNAQCVLQSQCNTIGNGQCTDINAQFNQCGSSCPPSCTNPNPNCVPQCVAGCFCRVGFVKQNDSPNAPCVLQNQCNSVGQCTDINSQFNQCGSSCPASCTNPNPNCIPQCVSGCFCRVGFVKQNDSPNAPCVLQNQCNSVGQCTDINSQFNQCGSSCPASCTNPNPNCVPQCVAGCFCKFGFVKQNDSPNAPCVLQNQCNSVGQCTDINAQFVQCGSSCPPSCTTPTPMCVTQCIPTCICKQGFIKQNDSPNAQCVMQSQCNIIGPNQCTDINAQFNQCGSNCPPSCTTPNPTCFQQCVPGCFCRNGFIKQSDAVGAQCVLSSQCSTNPNQQCTLPNEELQSCSNNCGDSCNGPVPCNAAQCVPRCMCRMGFVRQTASTVSSCILRTQCSTLPGTKVGVCPSVPLFSSNLPKTDYCVSDISCTGNLKCCDSLIGKVCMGADPQGTLTNVPGQCEINQQWSQCTMACILGCDNFRNPPQCPSTCGPAGCMCVQNFVKQNSADQRSPCVPISSCT